MISSEEPDDAKPAVELDLPDREQIYALTRAAPGEFEFLMFLLALS